MRVGGRVSDFDPGQLRVSLVAGFEGNQFGIARQSQQNRTSVENGRESTLAALGCVDPGCLASLSVEAEEVVLAGETKEQSFF